MKGRYHGIYQPLLYLVTTLLMLATVSICIADKCAPVGGFSPDSNGLCAEYMVRTEDGSCCACPQDFYLANRICNPVNKACSDIKCQPCLDCGNLHRKFKKACKPDKNTKCGRCMAGYYDPERDKNTTRKCQKCTPGVQSHHCLKELGPEINVDIPKVMCNKDEGLHKAHWDGQCPVGMKWNENIGCCQKCKGCGQKSLQWGVGYKVVCSRDLNQFGKHWDGQCPWGTLWSTVSRCCERYDPYSLVSYLLLLKPKQETPQADTSENIVCKGALNDFLPFDSGLCPSGTVFNVENKCCHGCPDCAPGWKRAQDCVGGCVACPTYFYSEDFKNNLECYACTNCTALNRQELFRCVPVKDTECGACLQGYMDNPDKTNQTCLKENNLITSTGAATATATVPVPKTRGCDQSVGEIPTKWDGSCLPGTKLCQQRKCCVPLKTCGPGYRHAFQENCVALCEPCPGGFFSEDKYDNSHCTRCLNCQDLHRNPQTDCSPTRNTGCGKCLPGYSEKPSENPGSLMPECIKWKLDGVGFEEIEDEDETTNTSGAEINMVLVAVIGVLLGGILTAVAAVIVFKCRICLQIYR